MSNQLTICPYPAGPAHDGVPLRVRFLATGDATWTHVLWFSNKSKTFKPRKDVQEGSKQYQLKKYAESTLGSGNLKQAVQLPEGEDLNEWLAVNSTKRVWLMRDSSLAAVDFYNQINMLYGTINEFCTPQTCPVMSAGPKYVQNLCIAKQRANHAEGTSICGPMVPR